MYAVLAKMLYVFVVWSMHFFRNIDGVEIVFRNIEWQV